MNMEEKPHCALQLISKQFFLFTKLDRRILSEGGYEITNEFIISLPVHINITQRNMYRSIFFPIYNFRLPVLTKLIDAYIKCVRKFCFL